MSDGYAENNTSDPGVTFLASEQNTLGDCSFEILIINITYLGNPIFFITYWNAFAMQLRPKL